MHVLVAPQDLRLLSDRAPRTALSVCTRSHSHELRRGDSISLGRPFDVHLLVATPPPPAQLPVFTSQPPTADSTEGLGRRGLPVGDDDAPDHEARRPKEYGQDGGDRNEPHEDAVRVERRGDPSGPFA